MKTIFKTLVSVCLALATLSANAQINTPRPSPDAKVMQKIGLVEATVAYSRPQMKGRKIFGDVVPFDKTWRTGANSPTKVSFSDSISVNGKKIAGGDYALYTIPNGYEWTVIFGNSTSTQAGDLKDEMIVLRFKVKPTTLPTPVESFTIGFVNLTPTSGEVELTWETTSVKFKLETDPDAKVMEEIKKKTEVDPNTLFQAASYYLETNRDLNKALAWITTSTDKSPQFWTLHVKAKIQAKLGDYKGAIATAQKSKELATAANNAEYVKFNDKVIADATAAMPVDTKKKKK